MFFSFMLVLPTGGYIRWLRGGIVEGGENLLP